MVSAVLVTRGDVPLDQITDSITAAGIDDIVVWSNAEREDLGVYGRYAGIAEAKHDIIYCQDDDCVVDPRVIVEAWRWENQKHARAAAMSGASGVIPAWKGIVCNQPAAFRHSFYEEHSLVGFGAVFHRDAPKRAFDKLRSASDPPGFDSLLTAVDAVFHFNRTCDVVFTALTPRVLVDVPYKNLAWAEGPDRMYRQPQHGFERARMLELALKVRDG